MKESTPPPPLPQSLSSRLQSSMNPLTGQCKFHPKVQLCELVQNNTRWVVRRKICYKCGSRPKGAGKHHMPGRCVSNVSRESKLIAEKTETSERGRQLKRSSSLVRSSSRTSLKSSSQSPADGGRGRGLSRSSSERKSSQSPADGGRGRGRSVSATRKTRSRSVSVGASGREKLNSSSRNVVQRRSTSVSRGKVARSGEEEKKKEDDKVKRSDHRHSKSMTAIESNTRVASSNNKTEVNGHSKENKTSYRERALEFTQKAMEASEDKGHSQAIVPRGKIEPDHLDDTDDFDESDPVIMIPNVHLDDTSLPPPPPRTSEERQIHEYRQELRRKHIRQQRRELSKSKSKLNVDVAEQQSEQKKPSSTRRHSTSRSTGIEDNITAPSTELRKSRQYRDGGRQSASKQRKRPDSPTPVSASPVHPSLAVLTALENHRQKVEGEEPEATQVTVADKQRQNRRRTSHDRKEKVVKIHDSAEVVTDDGDHVDEDAESETSSISSASAKLYQMQPESTNELRSRHPELKGVVSDPPQFPPVDVTVDRSRSRSRSRPRMRVGIDPIDAPEEREMQLVVHKSSNRRLSAAHGNGSAVNRRPSKIEVEKKSSREHDAKASDKKEVVKRSSERQLSKTSASRRPRPPQKSPAASGDRSKRTSRSYSGRLRGAEGSDLSGKRTTKSAERSPSVAKSSPALIEGNQRRCKSAGTSRSGRSPHTSVTQPESLSSDEFLQRSSSKEEPAAVMYKKTATKHSRKGEQASEGVKPMTAIRISEDEKSHASSISAGSKSTIEESSDCKGDDRIPADARGKATSVLKDVKGSAKNLAVKGKSAFGGLKGTSKKWQSALFV